jgi:hypothetical protein
MSQASAGIESQRPRALQLANSVQHVRATLQWQIAAGEISAADCLLDPLSAAQGCTVAEIQLSQRGWGRVRSTKFLARDAIPERMAGWPSHGTSARAPRRRAEAPQGVNPIGDSLDR